MTVKTTRRAFLRQVAIAGTVGPVILSGRSRAAAGRKLRHASIGVGHPDVAIVALCDVDRHHLEQAAKKHPGAALYQDWRELLRKEGDRIDSVNVTTPDHMHAPITMTALTSSARNRSATTSTRPTRWHARPHAGPARPPKWVSRSTPTLPTARPWR